MKQNRIYKKIIEIEHIKSTMYSTHEAEQNSQKNKYRNGKTNNTMHSIHEAEQNLQMHNRNRTWITHITHNCYICDFLEI